MSSDWHADDRPRGQKRPLEKRGTQTSIDEVKSCIEKRLFVARLPPDTAEDELRDIYSEFGKISECRIVPGRNWAFVRYDSWASAHGALIATDGKTTLSNHTHGHTVACSFAERKEVGRGGGAHLAKGLDNSRIFARNLPEDATEKDVEELFADCGKIQSISMLAPKSRRCCAFVTFSLWGEALDAIEAIDGTNFPGAREDDMPIFVVLAEPKVGKGEGKGEKGKGEKGNGIKLVAAPDTKRQRTSSDAGYRDGGYRDGGYQADAGCNGYNEVERLKVAYLRAIDDDSPDSVCSDLHESILAARAGGRPRHDNARAIAARRAMSGQAGPVGSGRAGPVGSARAGPGGACGRLFISGLPKECTDEELEALIEQVAGDAKVLECWVQPGRGSGYVEFSSVVVAEEAKDALDERRVTGWKEPLSVCWAPRKDEKERDYSPPRKDWKDERERSYSPPRKDWKDERKDRDYSPPRKDWSPRKDSRQEDSSGKGLGKGDKASSMEGRRIFVGKLGRSAELEDVRHLFDPFGEIEACRHISDKGIAYVTFVHAADANEACRELNGAERDISTGEGLSVKIAQPPKKGKS